MLDTFSLIVFLDWFISHFFVHWYYSKKRYKISTLLRFLTSVTVVHLYFTRNGLLTVSFCIMSRTKL